VVAPGARTWARLVLRSRRATIREAAGKGPWLVVAPHPDDESLGVGSLIAELVSAGGQVFVAFLTDGAGSHRDAPGWSEGRVGRVRAAEGRHALRCLGMTAKVLPLQWRDADPFAPGSRQFESSAGLLAGWCRNRGIRAIATTWSGDPHCDHEAAAGLSRVVAKRLGAELYEYVVWGWSKPDIESSLRGYRSMSVDVSRGRPRQRRAIACHRSQTGMRILGAPGAFKLPKAMIALADRPRLILLSERTSHAP
jgi:LmbE family N-acetylglucosaminyl deacetylase